MGEDADPVTQAGGRLSPDLVKTYAGWSAVNGVRFFPMYGQTEATARMAYLPPHLAAAAPCRSRPRCHIIGVPRRSAS